jgi:hypothetical protein
MSSSANTKIVRQFVAAAVGAAALSAVLGACSDIYYDRRETIALGGGDAVASNRVTHIADPWPRFSSDNNIPFNGERMQAAVECYRTGRVITPISQSTTYASNQTSPGAVTACPEKVAAPPAPAVVVNNVGSAGGGK